MHQGVRISRCNEIRKAYDTKMTMKVTYPDGSIEIIPDATKVDTQNFHEGMFDFYDEAGTLLKQIDMGSGIKWEVSDAPEAE